MEKSLSIVIAATILAAGILSGGALVFLDGDSAGDENYDNLTERLQELRNDFAELRGNFQDYKDHVDDKLENFDLIREDLAELEDRLEELENEIEERDPKSEIYEFSFENGMQGWSSEGTDLDDPPIEWSISPSQELSSHGDRSLKYMLANYNDAGKIWIERSFDVSPETSYRVEVSYDLASMDYGVNLWTIITGAYPASPLGDNKSDLIFQGDTGIGSDSGENFRWLDKSHSFVVNTDSDGEIFVNIGIWGTWETTRYYYLDNVRVEIEPVSDDEEPSKEGAGFDSEVFDVPAGTENPVIENGLAADPGDMERKNFLDLLTSEDDLELFDFSSIPQNAEEFIKSTDFGSNYLVVFQEYPASSVPDYRVQGTSRVRDTVNLFLGDSSAVGTDDITLETVLVKIELGEDGPFKKLRVLTEEGQVFTTNVSEG